MKTIIDYPNYRVTKNGNVLMNNNKIKAVSVSNKGYKRISLSNGGTKKSFSIHRLVALHFIDNPLNLSEVNHVDGNKLNNHIDNLEWCTPSYNITHSFENGLSNYKGELNGRSKITEDTAKEIKIKANSGNHKLINLSKEYNVSPTLVSEIKRGIKWSHI